MRAVLTTSWATVRGIYDYQPTGPDELALREGELLELTAGPSGGQSYADGWWEGRYIIYRPHRLRE